MKILHITDFHFLGDEKSRETEIRLVDVLKRTLGKYSGQIDFVLFTGDLVWSGENKDYFLEAKTLLIDKLCDVLNISSTSFFICPGNHDVHRNQELEDIMDSIGKIEDNDSLDTYVLKDSKKSLKASLENLKNYYEF